MAVWRGVCGYLPFNLLIQETLEDMGIEDETESLDFDELVNFFTLLL